MAVDTDSLINSAIEAKAALQSQRDNLEVERRNLVQQLGTIGPRNRAQAAQIKAQLSGLDLAERNLNTQQRSHDAEANLRVTSAFRNAHLAKQSADSQRDEQTAIQAAKLMSGVTALEAKYPNRGFDGNQGSKFHSEMEQLTNENPMGMRSKSAAALIRTASTFFDQERHKTLGTAAQKLANLTRLTPDEFASRDHSKDFSTNATSLKDAGKPDQRAEDGKNTVFEAGGKQYMIPTVSFNHYDSNFKSHPQAESAPVEGQVNVPADTLPKGTNYTFSGTGTPNHPGDYWSEPKGSGLVTHHFASGGSATVADHATPEGTALIEGARQQTADRKQFLEQNPGASTVAGGAIHTSTGIQPNLPANIPAAPLVEPTQPTVAAANPNVLVQPYQMGDEKAGAKPSVQVNPSAVPQAAIDPRMELAQRALVDPNATEAHKLAARQLLGIKENGE